MSAPTTRTVSSATGDAGALPNLVIVGAMKCGTTSLHRYLDLHPDVSMSTPKELNFFVGPDAPAPGERPDGPPDEPRYERGTWPLGTAWYASRFRASAAVRGESSPGYTSPDHPEVAARMAAVIPDATLVLCVRDPLDRALSQHRHHQRDGAERRPVEEALLDPASQYIARGRYLERLRPFLERYGVERIEVVEHDELRTRPRETVVRLLARFGVDRPPPEEGFDQRWNAAGSAPPPVPGWLRDAFAEAVRDDVRALREATGRELWPWI